MSNNLQYQILPNEPKYKPVSLTQKEKDEAKDLGVQAIGLWVLIAISITLAIGWLSVKLGFSFGKGVTVGFLIAIVGASAIVTLISSSIKQQNIADLEKEKAEKEKALFNLECRRANNSANSLTATLNRNYESSLKLIDELHYHRNEATSLLQDAEGEFNDNAFSPFWDVVENIANELANFNAKANLLSRNASEYYEGLKGKKHTFPIFPAQTNRIPDAESVAVEFRRIVRMGQTNFQFANIWEHRRTREVLIAGFRTLGEAVNSLAATLVNSVSNLQESVNSNLARLVEEEIKTCESLDNRMLEQNKMLDNIQHHRKPKITDEPTKY